MDDSNLSKRTYRSKRRKAQAQETRRQISEAARRLFTDRGYSGTSIEAIAHEAGVAPETVYSIFGCKKAILLHLVNVSLTGDEEPVPLLERPGPQAVKAEHVQERQVQMFASDICTIMKRVASLFETMNTAAQTEPEINDLLNRLLDKRLEGMDFFISALTSNGPLRNDLDENQAVETTWVITSAEVYNLLTKKRGWSEEQYTRWLSQSLIRLLLT